MTDTAIWNATAKRDRLAAKIKLLEEALTKRRAAHEGVSAWIAAYYEFAGTAPPVRIRTRSEPRGGEQGSETQPITDNPAPTERKRTVGNPRKEEVAAAARDLIEEVGEPISRADLFLALADRNIQIAGRDPEQVLSTMLWRTQKNGGPVVRLKSGGYWLAHRAPPDGDNVPSTPHADVVEGASRETALIDAIHDTLMRTDVRELRSIEAAMDFGGSIPHFVIEHMSNTYSSLLEDEDFEGDNFGALFRSAIRARLNVYERQNDSRSD